MQTFYMTDAGKVRTHNEDNVTIISNKNNEFILAVADGMGGHSKGELASKEIVDNIRICYDDIQSKCDQMSFFEIADKFEAAIKYANKKLYDEHGGKEICGSTIVAIENPNFARIPEEYVFT